ncbi:MAG: hypothetical protein ACRED5_07290 [Propylenella sp.]
MGHEPLLPIAREIVDLPCRKDEKTDDEQDGRCSGKKYRQQDAGGEPPIALTNTEGATYSTAHPSINEIDERCLLAGEEFGLS